MRITAKTDYAVRACVELAARFHPSGGDEHRGEGGGAPYVTAEAIAAAQRVSVGFMLGILNELKLSGIVESRRGADGGYRLAYAPDRIVVADIVRAIDGPLANVAGSYVEDLSYGGAAGSVREVWVALRASMRTVLEEVTLADVAAGKLPKGARALIADEAAWKTRPNRRQTRIDAN